MPAEVWIFVAACGLVCALLAAFGVDLYERARKAGDDPAAPGGPVDGAP